MPNVNPHTVSIAFCTLLDIHESELSNTLLNLFLVTDFNDYNRIKETAKEIKTILQNKGFSLGNSKILDFIAKAMGLKNNHVLKHRFDVQNNLPHYIFKMLAYDPKDEQMHKTTLQQLNTIINTSDINKILPQNLPDDMLLSLSIQYQKFRNQEDDTLLSALLLATVSLYSASILKGERASSISIPENDLWDYIELYGINILLEEMRRLKIISINKKDLPNVNNFFRRDLERKIIIHNEDAFKHFYD